MNALSTELLGAISIAKNAIIVWTDMKERLYKVEGYQLYKEIYTIHQGNSTISTYFSKLRFLRDEFDALVSPLSCKCDKSRTYVDYLAYLRIFDILWD